MPWKRQTQDEPSFWTPVAHVALGVLIALFLFDAYERARMAYAVKQMQAELERSTAAVERELRAVGQSRTFAPEPRKVVRPAPRPLSDGERCIQGRRFVRVTNGWEQLREPCG